MQAYTTTLFNNPKFSDITIKTKTKTYYAHRIIISNASSFFYRMFTSQFKESEANEIQLLHQDEKDLFSDILAFMYTGTITLTWDTVVAVLEHAEYYGIKVLVEGCYTFDGGLC